MAKELNAHEMDLLIEALRKRSPVYLNVVQSGCRLAELSVPDLRRILDIVAEEMLEAGLTEDNLELSERGERLDDVIDALLMVLNKKEQGDE